MAEQAGQHPDSVGDRRGDEHHRPHRYRSALGEMETAGHSREQAGRRRFHRLRLCAPRAARRAYPAHGFGRDVNFPPVHQGQRLRSGQGSDPDLDPDLYRLRHLHERQGACEDDRAVHFPRQVESRQAQLRHHRPQPADAGHHPVQPHGRYRHGGRVLRRQQHRHPGHARERRAVLRHHLRDGRPACACRYVRAIGGDGREARQGNARCADAQGARHRCHRRFVVRLVCTARHTARHSRQDFG